MRVSFPKGKQSVWINKLVEKTNLSIGEIAKACGVSERTVRDWRREKYTLSEKALLKLSKYFNIPIPSDAHYLSDYWYVSKGARKGALRRLELYGPPGTTEGRKKGGRISQLRRKLHPELYPNCILRKKFTLPEKSPDLAEIIGIILGDGGVTNSQLTITLGRYTDRDYAYFVQELLQKVFGELPAWYESKKKSTISLTISGVNLIENLSQLGIGRGDKIRRQIDLPRWVWKNISYQIACVRGLIDTDGGLYFHKHWTKGIKYRNLGLCFTSWSKPLLMSVSKILKTFNISHSIKKEGRIYIYNLNEIKKYFEIFGTNNPKHRTKINYHESRPLVLEKINRGGVA